MVAKRITPLLLAASVLVSGFVGGFTHMKPALAVTSVDELSDVRESGWAYNALKDLVEKYNVIEGYPDKTFRGNRAPTRYELAAALNATIKSIGKEIARLGAEKADKQDLATVAKLQEEFAAELRTLQQRTDALEARATKIEAKNDEQDNRLAILEKLKVYGDMSFGGFNDFAGNPGNSYRDGLGLVGRTRINFDYPIVEDKGGVVGPGTVHTSLVAGFGKLVPLSSAPTSTAGNDYSLISSIASDASFTDFTGGTSDVITDAYVQSTYFSQLFKFHPLSQYGENMKTTVKLHGGLIPWTDIFNKKAYQGSDLNQFQNSALVNNSAIFQDVIVPRVAAEIEQGLGQYATFTLKGDVSALNVKDAVDGIAFTGEGDLNYNLGFLNQYVGTSDLFNLSGALHGGYYLAHSSGTIARSIVPVAATITGKSNDNAQGFYMGLCQEVYKGIGLFGNFALNDSGYLSALLSSLQASGGNRPLSSVQNTGVYYGIERAISAGMEVPISALPNLITYGKRQNDKLGFGWTTIKGNVKFAPAGTPNAEENVMELYYKAQLNDNFALIPSGQIILSRSGDKANDAQFVVGLRSAITF